MTYGLIGERLGHSFSKQIHNALGHDYELISLPPEQVGGFIARRAFSGLNVTIPYKQTVVPYCDWLSDTAREIGSVNTLVMDQDGRLCGHNTDLSGFLAMARRAGIGLKGKKVVVLGGGGTSKTVCAAARREGAGEIVVVSRGGGVRYEDVSRYEDGEILVNATPVGMFPKNGETPIELSAFKNCEGVLDVIYNPLETALLIQAKNRGIPRANGLFMLVSQAVKSAELFLGKTFDGETAEEIYVKMLRDMKNIVLIGMPGCGKTTAGQILARKTGRELIDTDGLIIQKEGLSIPEIFERRGEAYFRTLETEAVKEAGKLSGKIIAAGGGAALSAQNRAALGQNAAVFFLRRDIGALVTDGRPLSAGAGRLAQMWEERREVYETFADITVDANGDLETVADEILEGFYEAACD